MLKIVNKTTNKSKSKTTSPQTKTRVQHVYPATPQKQCKHVPKPLGCLKVGGKSCARPTHEPLATRNGESYGEIWERGGFFVTRLYPYARVLKKRIDAGERTAPLQPRHLTTERNNHGFNPFATGTALTK